LFQNYRNATYAPLPLNRRGYRTCHIMQNSVMDDAKCWAASACKVQNSLQHNE